MGSIFSLGHFFLQKRINRSFVERPHKKETTFSHRKQKKTFANLLFSKAIIIFIIILSKNWISSHEIYLKAETIIITNCFLSWKKISLPQQWILTKKSKVILFSRVTTTRSKDRYHSKGSMTSWPTRLLWWWWEP